MQKMKPNFHNIFAIFIFHFVPNFAQHPQSIDEHFLRHSLLNKFLYQLHDQKGISEPEQSSPVVPATSFLFPPLQRTNGQIRHPFTGLGLPPSLAPSAGLLLPTPAQLPSIFRLPATAMAQNKAFPMDGSVLLNSANPLPAPSSILAHSTPQIERPIEEKATVNRTVSEESVEAKSGEAANVKATAELFQGKSTENAVETTQSTTLPSSSTIGPISTQQPIPIPTGANLSTSIDLDSFLQSKNVSTEQRAEFMRILEAEVARRLESHLMNNKSKIKEGEEEATKILTLEEVRRAEKSEQDVLDQQREDGTEMASGGRTRLELKTADTRLFSLASGEANEQQEKRTSSTQMEPPSSEAAGKEDYRQKEQEEFDKLLGQLREDGEVGMKANERGKSQKEEEDESDDLLLVVQNAAKQQNSSANSPPPIWANNNSTKTAVETSTHFIVPNQRNEASKQAGENPQLEQEQEQQLSLNRQHRFWSRHGPKNKFERLVEDYRFRLSGQGQNGLNDLIKALRNSHIGFFDANANPNSLKILRRIDRK